MSKWRGTSHNGSIITMARSFVLPEAVIGEDTAVLKGLDGRKMSQEL